MPTVFLSPIPAPGSPLFIPGGNAPASGGLLFQYATGTSNKLNTYTTSSGAVANANPIVLDSGGNLTGSREVWLIQSSSYRFVLAPSNDQDPPLSPYWTLDSISGVNDVQTQLNNIAAEWIAASTTPVFANASTFVLAGDQTATFTVGRRVKVVGTGITYGTISTSAFVTSTTILLINDTGQALDGTINTVSYSFLSSLDGSIPFTQMTVNGPNMSTASVTTGPLTTYGQTQINNGQLAVTSTFNHTGALLGFYSATVTTQAANVSSVSTTGTVSTAGLFGFTTSTQANTLVSTVNTLAATLKRYGLTA